jgi:PPOX class probable F420-dependent enzyme
MAISDEKYILLTTFRKDGTPVSSPVWIVALQDGKLGFWTSSGSGKYKRLRHTERVTLQPCDVRGRVKPGAVTQDASAALASGAEYLDIRKKVKAKYGFMTHVTKFLGNVGGIFKGQRIPYGDAGVVITPS